CSDNVFRHRSRPCLLHEIGKCSAPCVGLIDRETYGFRIGEAIEVLEGKGDELESGLRRQMVEASEREEYELAAAFRDRIQSLQLITQTQSVEAMTGSRDRDVVAVARQDDRAHAVILEV